MSVVAVWDNVHSMIMKKRDEIFEKYGRRVTVTDVASAAVLNGINNVEEGLGLLVLRGDK